MPSTASWRGKTTARLTTCSPLRWWSSSNKSILASKGSRTNGATEKRTLPYGAFLPTRHDHDHRTLQPADGTIYDHFRSQWPLQSLCGSRVKRIGGPGLCGTDLPSEHGLFRV